MRKAVRLGRRRVGWGWVPVVALLLASPGGAANLTVAAASDLRFALDEVVSAFGAIYPGDAIAVVYGSSGKLYTQIESGAPFDLYFSADIAYPRRLVESGAASGAVTPYARGRLVLWSGSLEESKLTLEALVDPAVTRIAIANPDHAPYGERAEEALRAAGVWDRVAAKIVYGENVSQAAQFVETGNAQVGILALSLALSPPLAGRGHYRLVPEQLHGALEQGFVVIRRAAASELARRFADFATGPAARAILIRYGFVLPGEAAER